MPSGEGGLPGDGLHGIHIRPGGFVPDIRGGQLLPVLAVAQLGLLVPEIAVPVGVKVQQQSPGSQDPDPLAVGLLRIRQIPGQVSGHQHIEAVVREEKLLRVHSLKIDLPRQSPRVAPGLLQHGGGVVHGGHLIAHLGQDNGEESRAGAHIQHPDALRPSPRKPGGDPLPNGAAPHPLLVRGQLLLIHAGIARGPVGPIVDVFLFVAYKLPHSVSPDHGYPPKEKRRTAFDGAAFHSQGRKEFRGVLLTVAT